MLSTLGQPHIVCGTAGSPPRRAVGGAPALETRARAADAPPGVWAARGAGLGSRGGAAAGTHEEAGAMDPEMTREKYPCSWPKGAGNFGELSEKEVKGRINSMKTTTVDLSDGFRFRYASVTQRGFYPHDRKKANQDSFVIAHNVGHKSHHFFGVFDGHGPTGDACSLFACENIKKIVVEKVKGQSANVPAALTDAYEKANRRLKKSPHDDSLSGTTAICVFSSGRKLYVGNVGDSRAMLGTSLGAVALSHDQTPFSKVERDRIKKCGGRIMSADQVLLPRRGPWARSDGGGGGVSRRARLTLPLL